MPPDLKAAHDVLDKSVEDCYGKTKFTSDAKRVGYLFELYDGLVKRGKKWYEIRLFDSQFNYYFHLNEVKNCELKIEKFSA